MLLAIVAVYLAAMLALGVWVSRTRVAGVTDFLLAGRRLGLLMAAGALAATHFGGGAVLGGAEYGYTHGAAGVWYGLSTGIGLLALGLLTARRFRDLSLFTVPDYLAGRYGGKAVRVLGALLSLVALVGILAAQVNAAGRAFAILGLEGMAAPVLAVAVFVAYTALGGLWAATISDAVQLAIAAVGVLVAALVVLARAGDAGGLGALLQAKGVAPAYFNPAGEGASFIFWLLLPTVMYTLIGQDFYQRLFAARDARTARAAALAGGVFLVVVSALPVVVGMGARALAPEGLAPGDAMPWVLRELMHPVLGGFILAAVLAAIMSTADSLLTSATAHVVKDVWIEALGRADAGEERRMLALSRVVTVVVGVVALAIGVSLPGIVRTLIYSYTMYTAGVLVPVLGGIVWKRGTRAGALAAIVAGATVALAGLAGGLELGGLPVEIAAAGVSATAFVIVSLFSSGGRAQARA
ncbi:MAG: sodium:solute symporter family protein [Candidatus Krumholzibacteria bacterium]|nr:sodium:solute symporter family protein [Candidatus Krumholzibacteria bacterium]